MYDRDRVLNILGWGAFAFSCSVFFLPVINPDIYWHLSAGKYTLAHFGPPHTDFLSWTKAGAEWVDFEWLPQVFYYLLYKAAGFRALLLFKALILVLTLLVFRATVLLYGRRAALPFLLPFFAAAIMSNCDLRPENFSLLFFSITLYFLEKSRLASLAAGSSDGVPPGSKFRAAVAVFFALWANMHAGYLYGLALIGLYAGGECFSEQLPYIYGKGPFVRPGKSVEYLKIFFLGLVSSLANPYGWKIYAVMLNHQRYMSTLQDNIQEWAAFNLSNAYQWPYALALAVVMGSFVYFVLRRRHAVYPHFAALLFFAWASANHARHIPFFIMTGLAFTLALPWKKLEPSLSAGALCLAAIWWFYSGMVWTQYTGKARLFKWGSEGMAAFLSENRKELAGLKLYNTWSWGGWIGWELGPDYKPFIDGRYIFHDRITEVTELSGNVPNWTRLIAKYKLDLALIKLDEPNVPVKLRLRNGSESVFWRPTYLFYLPLTDWAVIYWDHTSAALVRRNSVPAGWLAAREFRYLRPGDTASLEQPLLTGEVPLSELRRELQLYLRGHSTGYDAESGRVIDVVHGLEALCAQKGAKCAK